MDINNSTNRLVEIDNFCDYVPIVSSFTNLVGLFQKCIVLPFMQASDIKENHYFEHLHEKSFARCVLLLIPVLGNITIGILDFANRRTEKESRVLELADSTLRSIPKEEHKELFMTP